MILVEGEKYSCLNCIKGHRSSTCSHTDRPLLQVRRRGRPIVGCNHRLAVLPNLGCGCGVTPVLLPHGQRNHNTKPDNNNNRTRSLVQDEHGNEVIEIGAHVKQIVDTTNGRVTVLESYQPSYHTKDSRDATIPMCSCGHIHAPDGTVVVKPDPDTPSQVNLSYAKKNKHEKLKKLRELKLRNGVLSSSSTSVVGLDSDSGNLSRSNSVQSQVSVGSVVDDLVSSNTQSCCSSGTPSCCSSRPPSTSCSSRPPSTSCCSKAPVKSCCSKPTSTSCSKPTSTSCCSKAPVTNDYSKNSVSTNGCSTNTSALTKQNIASSMNPPQSLTFTSTNNFYDPIPYQEPVFYIPTTSDRSTATPTPEVYQAPIDASPQQYLNQIVPPTISSTSVAPDIDFDFNLNLSLDEVMPPPITHPYHQIVSGYANSSDNNNNDNNNSHNNLIDANNTTRTLTPEEFFQVYFAPTCTIPGNCHCDDDCTCPGCPTHDVEGNGSYLRQFVDSVPVDPYGMVGGSNLEGNSGGGHHTTGESLTNSTLTNSVITPVASTGLSGVPNGGEPMVKLEDIGVMDATQLNRVGYMPEGGYMTWNGQDGSSRGAI